MGDDQFAAGTWPCT